MGSTNFLIVSKEAWGDTRWARKQWLPYYLSERDDVGKVIYLDRHTAWWRGERPHDSYNNGNIDVLQKSLVLPFERMDFAQGFNRRLIAKRLIKTMSENETWVSLLYHPFDVYMINILKKYSQVVFDWTEDWEVFHRQSKMAELQRACVEQADIVFTVTKVLYNRAVAWRGSADNVFHIPNATSFDIHSGLVEPQVLKNICSPRVGFIGHAGPWFDEKLVAKLVDAKPDWQWVMVGGVTELVKQALCHQSNVHWLGVYKPEDIPAVMAYCDVLVAPYVQGIQGDATKLYDYLIAKKPILSTTCETSETLKAWVMSCNGEADWLTHMDDVIRLGKVNITDDVVRENHWSARAEQVMGIIKDNTDA